MDLEDHYCVRWKGRNLSGSVELPVNYFSLFSGFHSNIVNALEDLKSDEAFVDVTLSCDGETIQVGGYFYMKLTFIRRVIDAIPQ